MRKVSPSLDRPHKGDDASDLYTDVGTTWLSCT
jgi:hypothetical protein